MMFGLFLNTETCPDGVELVDPKRGIMGPLMDGPVYRFSTSRRLTQRLEIKSLENPIVVSFVNAKTDDARLKFLSQYGLLMPPDGDSIATWAEVGRLDVLDAQDRFAQALASTRKPADLVLDAINLTPLLKAAKKKMRPQLLLDCKNLTNLMVMEVAMISANGVQVRHCQHCHTMFVTGPLTWRRSHAKFCRDRCRVAASRKRPRT
jgi:hypothetical protein